MHVFAPIQTRVRKGHFDKVTHGMLGSGRYHVIIRLVLLEHHPHRSDVITRKSPITTCVEIAQTQFIDQSELDPRHMVGHLAGHKLFPPPGRFVIEQNPRTGVEIIALTVVQSDVVAIDLGDSVGTARVEGRRLALRDLLHLAKHLAGRGLVEAHLFTGEANGLQNPHHTHRVKLCGEDGLGPRGRHKRHCRQIVDLVGLHASQNLDQ